jgi:urease gamma subunit
MNLTPREKDKLPIGMAAIVARRRLEYGVNSHKFGCGDRI